MAELLVERGQIPGDSPQTLTGLDAVVHHPRNRWSAMVLRMCGGGDHRRPHDLGAGLLPAHAEGSRRQPAREEGEQQPPTPGRSSSRGCQPGPRGRLLARRQRTSR